MEVKSLVYAVDGNFGLYVYGGKHLMKWLGRWKYERLSDRPRLCMGSTIGVVVLFKFLSR